MAGDLGIDETTAVIARRGDRARQRGTKGRGTMRYIPGFLFILLLYIIGYFIFSDPRAPLFTVGPYALAWVEVLMVAAAIMAMSEQLKVSRPGENNIVEVLVIGLVAVAQIVLFTLGAAGVAWASMFGNTEFLLLTIINTGQTIVAFQINAATLMRTISG
ncbi:MAG: hypothetical protein ACK4MQ_08715 [Hyphomonas sp.]